MAYKFYGFKTFTLDYVDIDGKPSLKSFYCYCQNTRYGFRHLCNFRIAGIEKTVKCCYYNRTWERFTYESVLLKAVSCFDKEKQENFKKQIANLH